MTLILDEIEEGECVYHWEGYCEHLALGMDYDEEGWGRMVCHTEYPSECGYAKFRFKFGLGEGK